MDSPAGGFLSLGKLTARVETKGEGGRGKAEEADNQKSEIRNQKSPFPLPPSPFVVRTPTAIVTDLGTEFGVEVGKRAPRTSHVFRGVGEGAGGLPTMARRTASAGCAPRERVGPRGKRPRQQSRDGARPLRRGGRFVREIAKLTIETLDLVNVVAGGDGFSGRRNARHRSGDRTGNHHRLTRNGRSGRRRAVSSRAQSMPLLMACSSPTGRQPARCRSIPPATCSTDSPIPRV